MASTLCRGGIGILKNRLNGAAIAPHQAFVAGIEHILTEADHTFIRPRQTKQQTQDR